MAKKMSRKILIKYLQQSRDVFSLTFAAEDYLITTSALEKKHVIVIAKFDK